jgi:hypothetical protein
MTTRRRTKRVSQNGRPKATTARRQRKPPPAPRLSLEQEMMLLARDAGRTIRAALLALVVVAGLAGIGVVIWSLRPTPGYASEAVQAGSPFDVTFRIENESPWFPLANLRIYCVLTHVRGSSMPPAIVEAADVRLTGAEPGGLRPGDGGTFTCPLRTVVDHPAAEDASIAQRAEIYFRSEYDEPVAGAFRITDNSPPFVLNTRLLPPRWTKRSQP